MVDHKAPKMDLSSNEPNLNMPNREIGPIESEFRVKNTWSTTLGHLLTSGRPQNAQNGLNLEET